MFAYERITIPIHTINELQLYGTFYRGSKNQTYKGTILYFHGGGLIFGHREDLPPKYISLLAENGYGLLALDYLLAPESKLPAIMQAIHRSIEWFMKEGLHTLKIDPSNYYVMGRSAGGYLALYHAVHASVRPRGVIVFYGYYTLSDASFTVPSRHFLNYPKVSDKMIQQLAGNRPISSAPTDQRYPLYLAARQRGDWLRVILDDIDHQRTYSLTKEQLMGLPPTFITAAHQDPDVSVRQSKWLHKYIPESTLHIVESNEHDFDRTHIDTLGINIYTVLVEWLNNPQQKYS